MNKTNIVRCPPPCSPTQWPNDSSRELALTQSLGSEAEEVENIDAIISSVVRVAQLNARLIVLSSGPPLCEDCSVPSLARLESLPGPVMRNRNCLCSVPTAQPVDCRLPSGVSNHREEGDPGRSSGAPGETDGS